MRVQPLVDNVLIINSENQLLQDIPDSNYLVINTVKAIPANTFLNYKTLKAVVFDDTIQTINHDAFNGCTDLKFRLPRSLRYLGVRAFAGIKNYCDLVIPGTINKIGYDCFMYTCFQNVFLEEGIIHLGDVFRGAKVEKLYLPHSLEYLAVGNLNCCKEVVCFADTPMEYFCKQNFMGKINIRR